MANGPKKPLRYEETVEVLGDEPTPDAVNGGWPLHMEDIYLGTPTKRPTGTFTPKKITQPKVDPAIQPLWDKVMAKYPFAASFASEVKVDPTLTNRYLRAQFLPETRSVLVLDPNDEESLLHELTHGAQNAAFLDPAAEEDHYYGRAIKYPDRRGERTAYITAGDAMFEEQEKEALKKALGGQ